MDARASHAGDPSQQKVKDCRVPSVEFLPNIAGGAGQGPADEGSSTRDGPAGRDQQGTGAPRLTPSDGKGMQGDGLISAWGRVLEDVAARSRVGSHGQETEDDRPSTHMTVAVYALCQICYML